MRERLPNITIATTDAAALVRSVCAAAPDLAKIYPGDDAEGTLAARVSGPTDQAYVQLLAAPSAPKTLRVEVRASDQPTYDAYVQFARTILRPHLAAANKRAGMRLKLQVQTERSLEPKPLPPVCKARFDAFILSANKADLHPNDWRLFYKFVRAAPKRVSVEDVERLMNEAGFADRQVAEAKLAFWHLRHFLAPNTTAEWLNEFHRKGPMMSGAIKCAQSPDARGAGRPV